MSMRPRHPCFTCIFTVLIILLVVVAGAETTRAAEAKLPARAIAKSLRSYAASIGCLMAFDQKNVVKFNASGSGRNSEYVALFVIDPDCSGGSAMAFRALAVFEETASDRVFVRPALSFPIAENELPPFTERLFVEDGKLMYDGLDFDAAKDPLCCPSTPVRGQLTFRNGTWVTERARR